MTNISFFEEFTGDLVPKHLISLLFSLFVTSYSFSQTTIEGIVVDTDGEPIAWATAAIQSTGKRTTTDLHVKFIITTEAPLPVSLSISLLAYQTQEIEVLKTDQLIRTVLKEEVNRLEEVVVVGYSTARKSRYSGSVAVVGSRHPD